MHTLTIATCIMISLASLAHASDAPEGWPDSTVQCHGSNCRANVDPETAFQAYRRVRLRMMSQAGLDPTKVAAASAAAAVVGGVTWGTGRYLTYRATQEAAARAASLAAKKAILVNKAVQRAMSEFVEQRMRQIITEKGEQASATEVRELLVQDLAKATTKRALTAQLERSLGRETASYVAEKLATSNIVGEAAVRKIGSAGLDQVLRRMFVMPGRNAAAVASEQIADVIAAEVAPQAGRVAAGVAMRAAAEAAAGGVGRRALGWCLERVGLAAGALGSVGVMVVADLLLNPSTVGDGTLSGMYLHNPAALAQESDEERVRHWLRYTPGIANNMYALDQAMQEQENQEAAAGFDPENPLPATCGSPDAPSGDESAVCHMAG